MTSNWSDIASALVTAVLFVGTILGIIYVVRRCSSSIAATKESLKNKGITITNQGIALKMDRRFDRDEYVDATQRGLMKALNAATIGPESHKQAFLPPSNANDEHKHYHIFGMPMTRRKSKGDEHDESQR